MTDRERYQVSLDAVRELPRDELAQIAFEWASCIEAELARDGNGECPCGACLVKRNQVATLQVLGERELGAAWLVERAQEIRGRTHG